MPTPDQQALNYQRVENAIHYLLENASLQPKLEKVAKHVGLSPYHLQRVFSEWAGISPKLFLQYLTKEHAKQKLKEMSVMDASNAVGLSGSSRLHDLFITHECITPGEFKKLGDGLKISHGVHDSPFGNCFIASSERGIIKLAFLKESTSKQQCVFELGQDWSNADIVEAPEQTKTLIEKIFGYTKQDTDNLHLLLKGTPFQLKVWEALLRIPEGSICSYQQIASNIQKDTAVRAVASAIGKNDIAYLIPCHRVIRSTGALSNYRWGLERKAAMIGWEQTRKCSLNLDT